MSGWSAATLDALSRVALGALPDAYTATRRTRTPDGEGGWTEANTTVETGLCRLIAGAGGQAAQQVADRLTVARPYAAYLPLSATVTEGDALAIGSRTFRVLAVLYGGAYAVTKQCVLEENA